MENPPRSTTSYKHFWLELLRMDVRDWDFSPMSLHYRDLMTTAIALTNEGRRYDWVRLSQSIACIMTRKITLILPCPFTRADVWVRRRATTAKCRCCARGRTADSRKRDAHAVPIKRLVFFFLFSPTDCESPHLQNELKWTTFIFFPGTEKQSLPKPGWFSLSVCLRLRALLSAIHTGFAQPLLNIYAHASAKPELRGKLNLRNWFYLKVGDLWAILCCVNPRFQQFI